MASSFLVSELLSALRLVLNKWFRWGSLITGLRYVRGSERLSDLTEQTPFLPNVFHRIYWIAGPTGVDSAEVCFPVPVGSLPLILHILPLGQ